MRHLVKNAAAVLTPQSEIFLHALVIQFQHEFCAQAHPRFTRSRRNASGHHPGTMGDITRTHVFQPRSSARLYPNTPVVGLNFSATEWRKTVAHGASRGTRFPIPKSPRSGAAENVGLSTAFQTGTKTRFIQAASGPARFGGGGRGRLIREKSTMGKTGNASVRNYITISLTRFREKVTAQAA